MLADKILACCENEADGLSMEQLRKLLPAYGEQVLIDSLNSLLEEDKIELVRRADFLYYKAVKECTASAFATLNGDEQVLFNCIKATGNSGIWTRDIKLKTNLHQAIISKALRSLESKKLVKAVKSAKNSTKRLYMLYELEPSANISGGPWFTDFELDHEFVDELVCTSLKLMEPLILAKSACDIFPIHHQCPDTETLGELISASRVCNAALSRENVQQIVNRLHFDGQIHCWCDDDPKSRPFIFRRRNSLTLFGMPVGGNVFN